MKNRGPIVNIVVVLAILAIAQQVLGGQGNIIPPLRK